MSFVTDLPKFDSIWGASDLSGNEELKRLVRLKDYKARYEEFKPSFMAARQDSVLKDLQVTFGGFAPTVMEGEGVVASSYVDEFNERMDEHFAAKRHAAEVELARASEPQTVELDGSTWTYVLLDGSEARIERCDSRESRVAVPSSLGGFPVVAIGDDALSNLALVEEIICPDSIVSIGGCAFRGCRKLKRLVLPRLVSAFESSWFRHCSAVEELVLPGNLEVLKPDVFDNSCLKRLFIGAGTHEIAPGAFQKSKLERVEVAADNDVLASDGKGIYSKDGVWFVALAVPCEEYEVAAGAVGLAKRCMSAFSALRRIELPDSVALIGEFSFYHCSIERFDAPAGLIQISEKAFFRAEKLAEVNFNEGLRVIQDNAFTGTALAELRLPASIYHLGHTIAGDTQVAFSGADATARIADGAKFLHLDEYGALYRSEEDGLHLVRLMDPRVEEVVCNSRTRFIDAEACAKQTSLKRVALPEGLEAIRSCAFKGCTALAEVHVPSTVRSIGDEAFLDTNLAAVNLPASLEDLGNNALVTYYAHHGEGQPSIKSVEIAPELAGRYVMLGSLLCEVKPRGLEIMLCTGQESSVRIPVEVRSIAEYAFNGIRTIDELFMTNNIYSIGVRGIAIESYVKHLHIDLVEPIEGHDCFDFYFPDTPRSIKQLALAFTTMSECDIEMLFRYYDTVVCNGMGFGKNAGGLKLHEQVRLMLERLEDPIFMSVSHKETLTRFLRNNVVDVCEALARADDRRSIDRLIDLGYITEANLTECIDRVGEVQDAAMTGYLLEIRRKRFGRVTMDFSL